MNKNLMIYLLSLQIFASVAFTQGSLALPPKLGKPGAIPKTVNLGGKVVPKTGVVENTHAVHNLQAGKRADGTPLASQYGKGYKPAGPKAGK